MEGFRRITPVTLLTDRDDYVVIGTDKEDRHSERIAFTGTYDDCAAYAERNESPDNYERYAVAQPREAAR